MVLRGEYLRVRRSETERYRQAMGITHFVASMRVPGQVLKVKRIPSLSSASAIVFIE